MLVFDSGIKDKLTDNFLELYIPLWWKDKQSLAESINNFMKVVNKFICLHDYVS